MVFLVSRKFLAMRNITLYSVFEIKKWSPQLTFLNQKNLFIFDIDFESTYTV